MMLAKVASLRNVSHLLVYNTKLTIGVPALINNDCEIDAF